MINYELKGKKHYFVEMYDRDVEGMILLHQDNEEIIEYSTISYDHPAKLYADDLLSTGGRR